MEDKVKGNANEGIGKVKSTLGNATGDEKLEAEGKAQQGEGALQKFAGDVKDKVSDAVESAKEAIHDKTK